MPSVVTCGLEGWQTETHLQHKARKDCPGEGPTTKLNYHASELDVIIFPRLALFGTGMHWIGMAWAVLGVVFHLL